ncbi:DUF2917 domain-containing protein [Limnohabitans sp. 2KL-17]|uniref:DUF2917 domain-containing protein n=1 Tax=Limnohabitans sp. 2KL-17 TaxID=1100704 RepID=UPI001304A880|nr:DUF2917 domain-containing protein [Limnohabitans sp. 2KL-17]
MSEPDPCTSLQDCQKLKTIRWTGAWHLASQRAMSLLPRKDTQLLIVQGCAWITLEKPIGHWARSDGDHFLEAGQIIDVPAGARLVIEARHAHEVLHFDLCEMPHCLSARPSPENSLSELARQWVQTLGLLAWTTGRLVRGLWRPFSRPPQSCDLPV